MLCKPVAFEYVPDGHGEGEALATGQKKPAGQTSPMKDTLPSATSGEVPFVMTPEDELTYAGQPSP